jgi:sporadic carbohydrate cluster 2OG-Fe(II) oxygenase
MSTSEPEFLPPQETALSRQFIEKGYVVLPVEDRASLDRLRAAVVELSAEQLGEPLSEDPAHFLNYVHERVSVGNLNEFRLSIFRGLNADAHARPRYYSLQRSAVQILVGNELCMQRNLNLSIQFPGDDSSLLPIHGDVLNGDSPFEVVQWTPLVDVYATKSMFILSPEKTAVIYARFSEFETLGNDALYRAAEPDLVWIDVKYGEAVLFNQTLFHGNIQNTEGETRWSLNCRYKGVFTPYADKKLGEYFEPITLRAASRIGLDYGLPDGYREGREK